MNSKDMQDPTMAKIKNRAIAEIKGLFWALLIALSIRTLFYQPFIIPSPSMYPTLIVGDFILVSKFIYGFSNVSIPFEPKIVNHRVMDREPKVGDVVVFRNPKDREESFLWFLGAPTEGKDYIKRLIGKPGDRIQMKAGVLHINGEPVKMERIEDYTLVDYRSGRISVVAQYMETLPNGVQHPILKQAPMGEGYLDDTQEFTVPEDHYFMMGDNRNDSKDSRVVDAVGFVPKENLLGQAQLRFFSTSAKWYQVFDWIPGIRFGRIMTLIH